ncbi:MULTISPECIES: MetQ/NlpA family ABC transporter substrate-binding protein [unclassified Bradyrhizobium]|uniref:MetQ/NlpA family ABC transporter substrate-binding protein n=1 Tax=unclassified Bradyrhizobium TaxID=2631580 RepID=UPI00291619FD|nr:MULTISPECIES: MetQ/NlpA family ABC transporter substrate-binding protein [unclassified Bradyrhizobium]
MTKILLRVALAVGLAFGLSAAGRADEPLKIATSAGPVGQVVGFAAKLAKDNGLDVKLVELSDWVAINEVINSGEVDANLFQHATYLALQNKQRGYNLVQVDKVGVIAPVGLFSKKIKTLDEVKDGASVSIPNEPLNGARGLILLERAGLIKLAAGKGFSVSKFDIIENPKNLKIVELDPAQTYRSLDDVTLALVNITYLIPAGGDPKAALVIDRTIDDGLVLRFTARADRQDNPKLKAFIEVFKSPAVKQFIEEKLPAFIPAGFDNKAS